MKESTAVVIGIGSFAAGCALVSIYAISNANSMENKLDSINKGLRYIQDNVDLTVPEETASALVKSAASDIAHNEVIKATEHARNEIRKEISKNVKDIVSDSYKNVEGDIRNKLEEQINMQTIEKIQNAVSEKVAKQIVSNSLFAAKGTSSKEDIIKTCVENGMDAWEIRRILEASK